MLGDRPRIGTIPPPSPVLLPFAIAAAIEALAPLNVVVEVDEAFMTRPVPPPPAIIVALARGELFRYWASTKTGDVIGLLVLPPPPPTPPGPLITIPVEVDRLPFASVIAHWGR